MTNTKRTEYLLAGDIGGTKTALALYELEEGPLVPQAETTIQNDSVSGLDEILDSFLRKNDVDVRLACFGVAGPIIDNRVRLTNRDWTIDGQRLQKSFNIQAVLLINDLVATAMGAVHLPKNALHTINSGEQDSHGPVAVIAPGTGLGEAFMVRDGDNYIPYPSEGGHSLFSPADSRQARLLLHLQKQAGPITAENVCSGMAIPQLYNFLSTEIDEPRELAQRKAQADDKTKFIVEEAMKNPASGAAEKNLPVATLHLFTDILATEAANLVLKVLATGGLFIGGGLPPRMLPFLDAQRFMQSFARGVHKKMLSAIPVHVILEPKTALVGAAAYGKSRIKR